MVDKKTKRSFIVQVNDMQNKRDKSIRMVVDSQITGIQENPKYSYTISDISDLLSELKSEMIINNEKTFREFSILGMKLFSGSIPINDSGSASGRSTADIQEIESLQKELLASQTKINELSQGSGQLEEYQIIMDEKETEIETLKAQLTKLQQDIEDKSTGTDKRVQEYMEELNRLQEEATTLKLDKEKLNGEIDKIGQVMMESSMEIENLQTTIGAKDNQIKGLTEQVESNSEVQTENEALKSKVIQAVEKLKEKSTQIDNLEKQMNSVQSKDVVEASALKAEFENLREENNLLLADMADTSKIAEESQELIKELEEELETLRHFKEKSNEEEAYYLSDNKKKETRIDQLESEIKEILKSREEFEGKLEDKEHEFEKLTIQLEAAERSRTSRGEEHTELLRELTDTKSEVSELNRKQKTDERTIKSLEQDKAQHEKLNQESHEQIKSITEIVKQQRFELEKGANVKSKVEVQLETVLAKEKSLSIKNNDLEKTIKAHLNSIDELKNDIKQNNARNESMENKVSKAEERLDKYKQGVKILKKSLEESDKYKILFLVQELKSIPVSELAKASSISIALTKHLLSSLKREEWVEITEDNVVKMKKKYLDLS